MFTNYLTLEQKQFLLQLSLDVITLKNSIDPKEKIYLQFIEEEMQGLEQNISDHKKAETVFNTPKVRFIALFELYLLVLIKGELLPVEESCLSWLGQRFGFSGSDLTQVFDLAKSVNSLLTDAKYLIQKPVVFQFAY